ncbi:hypothetical protein TB1_012806 [Malus domestica]
MAMDGSNTEELALRCFVSIKTTLSNEFQGQAEDPLDIKKCYLDLNILQAREELVIRQAEAKLEQIAKKLQDDHGST